MRYFGSNQMGLKGNYDIKLNFAPMNATDSSLSSVFTAIEEQSGLKLKPKTVSVEMFVADHVDRVLTEN